jgi:glucose-6-phosphate isomerase, archaeal
MIDLTPLSGLTVKFDPECLHIAFGEEVRDPIYGTRLASQMRRVLLDTDCDLPEIIYWMMRDLGLKSQPNFKQEHDLRYDISFFRGCPFGREFMKTSGHYHPYQPGSDIAWPEVYEVLSGQALYVLQKVNNADLDPADQVVEDVIIVEGNPGDKVIMPPNYGHVTINALSDPLLMSNWVSSQFGSVYGKVEQAKGFAFYLLHGDGTPRWVKNPLYRNHPPLRRAVVREVPELGLTRAVPLYMSAIQDPAKMKFLNDPASCLDLIWSGLEIVGEVEVSDL